MPEVVFSMPNTIVMRDELHKHLSWAVQTDIEAGKYVPLEEVALRNYTTELCPEAPIEDRKSSLGIKDFGALLAFLMMVGTGSLIINKVLAATHRQMHEMDKDGDGHVTALEMIEASVAGVSTVSNVVRQATSSTLCGADDASRPQESAV